MKPLHLADDAATAALGAALARTLQSRRGVVIFLEGSLGAGKTTLARGLLRALGATGPLRSPTYTLIEPYELGERRILHADLYRLSDPFELEQLGLSDYPPDETWWLVEWPEKGGALLPAPDLTVRLRAEGDGRTAEIGGPAADAGIDLK